MEPVIPPPPPGVSSSEAESPKLDLQDQFIPPSALIPLEEEITDVEKAKLIDSLIAHINKIDFPPRFRDIPSAMVYLGIMSDAQIIRLNQLADDIKRAKEESAA